MKTFTNKKIEDNLSKVDNLNFAVVLKNGELYIHQHGQMMLESVYNNKDSYCDVTEHVQDYINNQYNKKDTARIIREVAEIFYDTNEQK